MENKGTPPKKSKRTQRGANSGEDNAVDGCEILLGTTVQKPGNDSIPLEIPTNNGFPCHGFKVVQDFVPTVFGDPYVLELLL